MLFLLDIWLPLSGLFEKVWQVSVKASFLFMYPLVIQGESFSHTDFMCLFDIVIFLEGFCEY